MYYRSLARYLSVLSLSFMPLLAHASGFRINLDNVSDLGNAFAGGAALTQDASVNAFNAAGLAFIGKNQLVVNAIGVLSHTTFTGTTAAPSLIPPITVPFFPPLNLGTSFSAIDAKVRSNSNGVIPSVYYNYPVNERLALGISANSPFGLGLDYGENSELRYALVKAYQKSINIAPSIAYLVTPKLSVGLGPNFQNYSLEAVIKQNTVSTGATILLPFPFPPIFIPPTGESENKVNASNWGYGAHIGVLYAPQETTHIGIAYRSQIFHNLSGKSEFASGTTVFGNGGNSTDNFRLKFTVPPNIMVSVYQVLNPRWSVLGTIDYTMWQTFNYVTTYNVAQGTANPPATIATPERFKNTWHAAIAANYIASEHWLLRAGLAYDQKATITATRTVEFPNGDLMAAAIGARYTVNARAAFDLGYIHSFIRPTAIRHTNEITGASENGKLQTTGDTFGLGMVLNFC